MSMDRSLKSKASLARHRNVLTRTERIGILKDQERFRDGDRPSGLPKVAHRKAPVAGKTKKAATETPAEGAAATAPAAETPPAKTPAKPPAKK